MKRVLFALGIMMCAALPISLIAQLNPAKTTIAMSVSGTASCGKDPLVTVKLTGPSGATGTAQVIDQNRPELGTMSASFKIDTTGTTSVLLKSGLSYRCDGAILQAELKNVKGGSWDGILKFLTVSGVTFKEELAQQ